MTQGERRSMSGSGLLRSFWSLPGAVTGAATGFRLYFRQPNLNTDSAAPLFGASLWACAGLVAGALTSVAIAAIIARTLRRLLPANGSLTELLALSCTLALCSAIYAPIEARLPALFWPAPPRDALPRPMPQPAASACDQAPPADPAMRRDWDTECR